MSDLIRDFAELLEGFSPSVRIAVFMLLAALAHVVVRTFRNLAQAVLRPRRGSPAHLITRYPKIITVLALLVSALTFAVYFSALGFILHEFGISLRTYFASATIVGLAVAFGSQGLVQDVVTGITLIFSDALDVGDMVDFSTQPGRVEKVGLRFTTISTSMGRELIIPNRNIGQITRFPKSGVRALLDVQVPDGMQAKAIEDSVLRTAESFRRQHRGIVLGVRSLGVMEAGEWRFARIELEVLPGQQALIEGPFQQRVVAAMQALQAGISPWMVTVTYRPVDSSELPD